MTRLSAVAGLELARGRRVQLSVLDAAADFGNPGALTRDELDRDRRGAPFNALDFTDEEATQAVVGFTGSLTPGLSLSTNLYRRERDAQSLSTGRSAAAFGGFFLDSETMLQGVTAQLGWGEPGGDHQVTVGGEWIDGDTDARGFLTSPADLGHVDPSGRSSDNTAERRVVALYLQDSWDAAPHWTVSVGLRWDDERTTYDERFPDEANDARRDFSELSVRAGVVWLPADAWELYASYGEGFLPPTPEDLFSFPGFGSNPELEPEDSSSLEVGARRRFSGLRLEAALFQIDTRDEIVFDPEAPLGPFGANVNAGEARRRGVEASLAGRVSDRLGLFANLTWTEAELTGGENRGHTVPLVPESRLAAGFDVTLPAHLRLYARGLYVGEQVLANDEANRERRLADYTVLDARLRWSSGRGRRVPALFLEATNLLDEEYATRGIAAFDFSTFQNGIFLTPAPGRRWMAGIEWEL
jgi:iron complex outermembrane receptor protein